MSNVANPHAEHISTLPRPGHHTALLLLFLAFALSIADRVILSVLFEPIKTEFNLSDTQLGLLGGLSFAIFYATLSVPIARMADRRNRSKIIIASLVTFSVAAALCGLATGFVMLVVMRIAVGIGEAGVNPASHSILADYYPPEKRASALSILTIGANAGMIFGFLLGGIMAQYFGWRVALIAIACPGLVLALVMWWKLKEPQRGYFETLRGDVLPVDEQVQPPIGKTLRTLWAIKSYRQMLIGSTISGAITYGSTAWVPTHFIRAFDLTQTQAGMLMALIFGLVGAAGAFTGGKLVDKLSQKGFQYGVWMIAITQISVLPFAIAAYLVNSIELAVALLIPPIFVMMFYLGPIMALIQTVSPLRMRATASAIKMFTLNFFGMSLGPLIVGVFSDYLEPLFGSFSIGIALAALMCLGIWSAFHFYLCGKALAEEFPHPFLQRQTD